MGIIPSDDGNLTLFFDFFKGIVFPTRSEKQSENKQKNDSARFIDRTVEVWGKID
jgi:hypothetical protein